MAAVRSSRSRISALLAFVACALVATALHCSLINGTTCLSFVFGRNVDGPKAIAVGLGQQRFRAFNFDDQLAITGAKFKGKVTQVFNFGAFVDIGWEYEGLVPKSKISDDFIREVEDVVKVGDVVTVWVVSNDKDSKKLMLSMTERKISTASPPGKQDLDDGDYVGAKFRGEVTKVVDFGAFVDIGWENVGLVPKSKISVNFIQDVKDVVKVGDIVTVWVVSYDKDSKKLTLSMTERKISTGTLTGKRDPNSYSGMSRNDLDSFSRVPDDMWLSGVVSGTQEYGVFVRVSPPGAAGSAQGLVPLAEMKDGYVADITKEFKVGQIVKVRIRNVDLERKRLALSMKEKKLPSMKEPGQPSTKKKRRKKSDEKLPPADLTSFVDLPAGTWLDGTVASTVLFGAFVKVSPPNSKGVFEGLVPFREVRDGPVNDMNEVVSAGQVVKVRVIDANVHNNRLTLSMKPEAKKKTNAVCFENVPDTDWFYGTVVTLQNHGAVVEVEKPDGTGVAQGFLHVSQIQDEPLEDPGEVLEEEQEVTVRVIEVDAKTGTLSFSLKTKQAVH